MITPESVDLCSYNDELTTTSFDIYTGDYSISSLDFAQFEERTFEFMVTGTSGSGAS